MKKIEEERLENIVGGSSNISGTIINAFVNVIKLLIDAGESVGSSLRRISADSICPLK